MPLLPGSERMHREPAQALHESEPQHDGNRPQLSNRERRDILVRLGKAPKRLLIEASSGVRDEIPREHVNARIAAPAAGRQRWKLLVELTRKVSPDFQQLRADHVVVVAQPLFRGGLGALSKSLLGKLFVNVLEALRVAFEPRQQLSPGPATARDPMLGRKRSCARLELLERKRRSRTGEIVLDVRKQR